MPGTTYPSSVDTSDSLFDVRNNAESTLNGGIGAGDTTITVASTSLFPSSGSISIAPSEVVYYTSKNATQFLGCTRGQDGTTAASHSNGAVVRNNYIAAHRNYLRDAIIALQNKLGANTQRTLHIGSSTPSSGLNFDLKVSGDAFPPTLRYNGSAAQWQFSPDGLTFIAMGGGSGGVVLNGQSGATQTFGAVGSAATAVAFSSSGDVHTLNVPDASNTLRGFVNLAAQTWRGGKTFLNEATLPSVVSKVVGSNTTDLYQGRFASDAVNFSVSYQGDITSIRSIPYQWPTTQATEASVQVLTNSGTGVLSWGRPKIKIQEEGTDVNSGIAIVNFTGAGVTASLDVPNNRINVDIPGGGGGGGGSVTSVGLSMPGIFSVSGSPVTGSGTLTASLANQSANRIFAGPTTGADAAPAFRALVAADLPSTAVTPGSYTNASLTVDAQGRLTAASSGAGGTPTVTAYNRTTGTNPLPASPTAGQLAFLYDSRQSPLVVPMGLYVGTSAGKWMLAGESGVNVRDFGAKGDYNPSTGLGTDDTQAFLDAIEFAGFGGSYSVDYIKRGLIIIPPGYYKIRKPLGIYSHENSPVPAKATIYFKGWGRERAILFADYAVTTLTGSVTLTGTSLAGSGTSFLSQLAVGDFIQIGAAPGQVYRIAAVTSDTAATTSKTAYPTSPVSGTAYKKNDVFIARHDQQDKITVQIEDLGMVGVDTHNATAPQCGINFWTTSTDTETQTGCILRNLYMQGFDYGVRAINMQSSHIENPWVSSCKIAGIAIEDDDATDDNQIPNQVKISALIIDNLGRNIGGTLVNGAANGIYVQHANTCYIDGGTIQGGFTGGSSGRAIYILNSHTPIIAGVHVELGATSGFGIELNACMSATVMGCTGSGLASGDLKLVGCKGVDIRSCYWTNDYAQISADSATTGVSVHSTRLRTPWRFIDNTPDGIRLSGVSYHESAVGTTESVNTGLAKEGVGTNYAKNPNLVDGTTEWFVDVAWVTRVATGGPTGYGYLKYTPTAATGALSIEVGYLDVLIPDNIPAGQPWSCTFYLQAETLGSGTGSNNYVDIHLASYNSGGGVADYNYRLFGGQTLLTVGTWYTKTITLPLPSGTSRKFRFGFAPTTHSGTNVPIVRIASPRVRPGTGSECPGPTQITEERDSRIGDSFYLGLRTMRLYEASANGTNYIAHQAPASLAGNLIYVWPTTDPTAGQVLSASAPSGGIVTLSWVAN